MITKQLGKLKIKLYSGIDELTAERYHKFNLYCLMSSGIGNDVESIKNHIAKIYESLAKKDFDRLTTLFQNYFHSLYYITEQLDTQSIAFCCLVHSINGKEITDLSDDNLRVVSDRINKSIERPKALQLLEEIKKKLKPKSNYITPIELAEQKQRIITDYLKDIQT